MSMRTNLIILAVALVVAIGTAYYARNWIAAEKADILASMPEPAPAPKSPEVLVAVRDLPTGTFVKPDHLKWQPWPKNGIAEGYTINDGTPEGMEKLVGTVVRSPLVAGQPLIEKALVKPGDRGFLAAVLSPGARAVSVPINATSGISGFIFPGDLVDVVLTVRVPQKDGSQRFFTQTLESGVRVLAIDQATDSESAKLAKTATLEVSRKQAEKINLGLAMGSLSLSLRSLATEEQLATADGEKAPVSKDSEREYTSDAEVIYMLQGASKPAKRAQSWSVEIVRGDKSDSVTVR